MNFFQQNLDLIGHFKNKAICIRRKIFIFFPLKKKKKNEMAQGRVPFPKVSLRTFAL